MQPSRAFVPAYVVVLALAFALSGFIAAAGDDLSRVEGVVADAAGAPIAGARVTMHGEGVQPATAVTAADGSFRFWGLRPIAGYRVAAEKDGYRTVEYDGMRLESGRTRTVRFRLKHPDERDLVALVSRDPFPHAALVSGLLDGLTVPARVIDLDTEPDAAETVRHVAAEKPSVIVSAGLRAARLVRSEVRDIPSIMTLIDDPRRYDLAAANTCFLTNNPDPEDVIARLAALLPGARRVGLVYGADTAMLLARDLLAAAEAHGHEVVLRPCYAPERIADTLSGLEGRIDVLLIPYDALSVAPAAMQEIAAWGLRHRVAVMAPQSDWLRPGVLLSYGVPPDSLGAQARHMAADLLSGARQPGDLGLRRPQGPVLAVDRATARALGLNLPGGE